MGRIILATLKAWLIVPLIAGLASSAWGDTFGFSTQGAASIGVNQTWCYSNRYPPDVYGVSGGEILTELWVFIDPPAANYTSKMGVYKWSASDSCVTDSIVTSGSVSNPSAGAGWMRYDIADKVLTANDTISIVVGNFQTGTWYIYETATTDAAEEHTAGDLPASLSCDSRDDWRLSMFGCINQEGGGGALGHSPDTFSLGTNWTNPDNGRIDDNSCATYNNTGQDYVCYHDFDFSIPSGVTIDSFDVTVQVRGSALPAAKREYRIGLTKDSTNVYGTARLDTANNAGACSDASNQTNSGDLFGGASWSGSDINGRGFGVILYDDDEQSDALDFDAVWVTVYFTPAAVGGVTPSPRRKMISKVFGG